MKRWRRVALIIALLMVWPWLIHVPKNPVSQAVRVFRGAMHVHVSEYSHDARQSMQEVIAAARRADLDFVVLTDHNRRAPAPFYDQSPGLKPILVVPAMEVFVPTAHVLHLRDDWSGDPSQERAQLTQKLADHRMVHTSGDFNAAAHPDSYKLNMSDDLARQLHGYEVLSSSSDFYARLRSPALLALLAYPSRAWSAYMSLYSARAPALERYDRLTIQHRTPLLCGVDAHGFMKDAYALQTYVTYVPSYVPTFDAVRDAQSILHALYAGENYCTLGLLGDASPLSITVHADQALSGAGSEVALPALIRVRWQGVLSEGHAFYLYQNGVQVAHSTQAQLDFNAPSPGVYRLEVARSVKFLGISVSYRWIYANPIYVRPATA